MEVRNLLVVTGEWKETTEGLIQKIKQVIRRASDHNLDIIIANSGNYQFDFPHYSIEVNSDTRDIFYSFICLNKAVNFKQTQQLENLIEYKYCFHLSTSLDTIDSDLNFILPQSKNIVCIKGTKIGDLIFPSTKLWATTGLDFDAVGSLYKSGIRELFNQNGHASNTVEVGTTADAGDILSGLFLTFLNTLHIHEVYLSHRVLTEVGKKAEVTVKTTFSSKPTVAICLSGETRSLELTIRFFKYLASIEDIDFHFFIATWESNYNQYLKKIPNLKSISILDETEYAKNIKVESNLSNNHRYSFLLKKCNLLKQEYELTHNFIYDYVVMSRPDCVFAGLHECIVDILLGREHAKFNNNLYLPDSIQYNRQHYNADDNIALSSSYISDIYTNIHFIYYNNTLNRFYHSLQVNAYIIHYYSLNNLELPFRNIIIRPCNLNRWLKEVINIDYTNRNTSIELGSIKKKVNNLRMQEGFKGNILIDIRKYDILLSKSGFLPALEHYIYNLGWRTGSSNIIFLCSNEQKKIIQDENICKDFTFNSINFDTESTLTSCIVNFSSLADKFSPRIKRFVVIEPKIFLNYQHNQFVTESILVDFSLLKEDGEILDHLVTFNENVLQFLKDKKYDSVKDLIKFIDIQENLTKLEFNIKSITDLETAIQNLSQ